MIRHVRAHVASSCPASGGATLHQLRHSALTHDAEGLRLLQDAGLGLIVGLLTRIAAGGMFIEMLGAVLLVHLKGGFFAENKGYEYPLTLCLVCLALMLTGAGAYSLDALLHRNARPAARPEGVAGGRVVIPGRRAEG